MRVAVVGCGIAGLSFSAALLQADKAATGRHSVVLFDTSERPSWLEPTGEVSLADGEALFRRLQLGSSTWASLQRTSGLTEFPWPPRRHERVPRSSILQGRAVRAGAAVHWGAAVTALRLQQDGTICCHMKDGHVERGFDLVVGADGLLSSVRQMINNQPELGCCVALVGDSRRHFGLECDLGMGRVLYGASRAMRDGLELSEQLSGAKLSSTSKFALVAHDDARKMTVMMVRALFVVLAGLCLWCSYGHSPLTQPA